MRMPPPPPEDLSQASARLWRSLAPRFMTDPLKVAILEQGLRGRDLAESCAQFLADGESRLVSHLRDYARLELGARRLFLDCAKVLSVDLPNDGGK
jgi:hypothetical protein